MEGYLIVSILALILIMLTACAFALWRIARKNPVAKPDSDLERLKNSHPKYQEPVVEDKKVEQDSIRSDSETTFEGPIWLGDDLDPLLTIEPFSESNHAVLRHVEMPKQVVSSLSAVFQAVPATAISIAASSSNLVKMILSPELAHSIQNGSAEFMKAATGGFRGTVVSSGAKTVVGQASFDKASLLKNAAVATACWQVASVIVAQKHLADISRKLDNIAKDVRDIKQWLEQERIGKLEGNINYLKGIGTALLQGALPHDQLSAYHTNIEEIERECNQIIASQLNYIDYLYKNMPEYSKIEGTFGTAQEVSAISNIIEEFSEIYKPILLAQKVRIAACAILSAMPDKEEFVKLRANKIKEEIQVLPYQKDIYHSIKDLIMKIDSIFTFNDTIEERKRELYTKIDNARGFLNESKEFLNIEIGINDRLLLEKKKPIEIIVERYPNGQISQICTLSA